MKFIKKHLFSIISIVIILTIVGVGIGAVYTLFYDFSSDPYENRLNGIEKVQIADATVKAIEEQIMETDKVETVKYSLEGRLVNFIVDIKNGTALKDAKEIGKIVENNFSDEEKKFYDFQIFIANSEEQKEAKEKKAELDKDSEEKIVTVYPVIGYKHKNTETFVWTK